MSTNTLVGRGAVMAAVLLGLGSMASAQEPAAGISVPAVAWPMPAVEWQGEGVTELTLRQIRDVEAEARSLEAPEAARAAGFRPALGVIPTMGEHWVHRQKMNEPVDRADPAHLMFSPINGEERLVGVAYAFRRTPEAAVPDAFDGTADRWHDHPELARGDETLTMLHVWFVPSLDGPFAGHNSFLPFWAVGLEPRDVVRLDDPADVQRLRAAAVALAESYGSSFLNENLSRLLPPAAAAQNEEGSAAIRGRIPRLHQAQLDGDREAWNDASDEIISIWNSIHQARLEAIPFAPVRDRLDAFYQEMLTGGHGHAADHSTGAAHAH